MSNYAISSVSWGFRCRRWALWLLVMVTLPSLASASSAAGDDAEAWLSRLGPALNMTTYRGVFVYSRGDQVSSMRIAHRYRDGQVEERLVQQDGASGEIVRKGTQVVCVLPDHGRVKLDQVTPSGPFADTFASQRVLTRDWYQPQLLGEDRVAGYSAKVVGLNARDGDRYSYRLWLEKDTGLLLKSHVRGQDGSVLESFQFTDLEITDSLPDSEFEIQLDGQEIRQRVPPATAGEAPPPRMDGWYLGWRPDGFLPAAAPVSGDGQAVAFSDGLAAFSVFVEPAGRLDMPTGASRIGATTAYMRPLEAGEQAFLVTVIGEIPPQTAMKVAESVAVQDAGAFGAAAP
ncbi:MucB/RseB C-terminal domain-containing protein [Marinobacter sp. CA1]|uniref:MucB/RseB C-terminal domain-containing protein n=1 Tax=Marinobacter sp. CA1 TaxID=2817656 RepID=UPI002B4B343F|nr:MucB/RseB C-terminal domain-containing protein [Marinobacter sp. CA1]